MYPFLDDNLYSKVRHHCFYLRSTKTAQSHSAKALKRRLIVWRLDPPRDLLEERPPSTRIATTDSIRQVVNSFVDAIYVDA